MIKILIYNYESTVAVKKEKQKNKTKTTKKKNKKANGNIDKGGRQKVIILEDSLLDNKIRKIKVKNITQSL